MNRKLKCATLRFALGKLRRFFADKRTESWTERRNRRCHEKHYSW